jgi:hypothetical protein
MAMHMHAGISRWHRELGKMDGVYHLRSSVVCGFLRDLIWGFQILSMQNFRDDPGRSGPLWKSTEKCLSKRSRVLHVLSGKFQGANYGQIWKCAGKCLHDKPNQGVWQSSEQGNQGGWYQASRPDSSATIMMKIIWWAQNTKTSVTHGNMSLKLVLKSEFSFCTTPIST